MTITEWHRNSLSLERNIICNKYCLLWRPLTTSGSRFPLVGCTLHIGLHFSPIGRTQIHKRWGGWLWTNTHNVQTICHGTRHKTRDKCYILHGNGLTSYVCPRQSSKGESPEYIASSFCSRLQRTHLASRGPIWLIRLFAGTMIGTHLTTYRSMGNIFTCLSTDCLVPVTKTVLVQMMLHCVDPPLHNHLHQCESNRSETGCYVVSGKQ